MRPDEHRAMSNPTFTDSFECYSEADWLTLVKKTLRRDNPLESLTSKTLDGLEIRPLYTRENAPAPSTADGTHRTKDGWRMGQIYGLSGPAETNAAITADIHGGVGSQPSERDCS